MAARVVVTEFGERPEKLALMIRALASLKLIADHQAAVMVLKSEDFGFHFARSSTGIAQMSVTSVASNPLDPDELQDGPLAYAR